MTSLTISQTFIFLNTGASQEKVVRPTLIHYLLHINTILKTVYLTLNTAWEKYTINLEMSEVFKMKRCAL